MSIYTFYAHFSLVSEYNVCLAAVYYVADRQEENECLFDLNLLHSNLASHSRNLTEGRDNNSSRNKNNKSFNCINNQCICHFNFISILEGILGHTLLLTETQHGDLLLNGKFERVRTKLYK